LIRRQPGRIVLGAVLGSASFSIPTLAPYVLSRAVDDGLVPGDMPTLLLWAIALLGVGCLNAWLGILRHRTMTRVRMDANLRTVRMIVAHAVRLGAVLPGRVATGEVAAIGFGDVTTLSQTLTVTGPGIGAVVTYLVVAALLFSVSAPLALVVLVGLPVVVLLVGPLVRRLHATTRTYRRHHGDLAARFVDMTAGLRVLGGLGGKDEFARRYRQASQELQAQGYRLGAVTSWIEALRAGLPALFLGAVTWLAARMTAQGAISVGDLVAVYGYVAVVVIPVWIVIESAKEIGQGLVAAGQVVRFLALSRPDPPGGSDAPAGPAVLRDPASGFEVRPRTLTALVSARSADAAEVVDRLARFAPSVATWGDKRLDAIAVERIRERIVVADNDAHLFAGRLRDVVLTRDVDDAELAAALHVAVAHDIVDALPDGLDSPLAAQGANLSGGQRQRVRLVRALLADPEVLLAVEPTSALDAHTEAAVAARLREARRGRTTVVTGTSPLLLACADTVAHLVDGRVVATGSHRRLLAEDDDYRRLVSRSQGEER
jgi:ABC-type multidrug transport system fused ATPase/permease subunit